MNLYKTFLLLCVFSTGCTSKLEERLSIIEYSQNSLKSRLSKIESSLNKIEQGLLANDKNIKDEIIQLKDKTEAELSRQRGVIYEIKQKTDKFCVHTPDANSLQIFRDGQCP
jgi:methyl-accepting chemotaxis protein